MSNIGYFQFEFYPDAGVDTVAVVLREYWEDNHVLADDGSEQPYMPTGFFELSDAIYEYDHPSRNDAKMALEANGFVESKLM